MRRRYVSLVATPGLVEAHLLIFENEAKWVASNPPTTSTSSTPSPIPSASPPCLVTEPRNTSLQTIEQLLQADDGSRKGAKYVVRLEGLFYVGVSHLSVYGRLSVTAAIKSVFGKLVVGSKNQDHHQQKQQKHPNSTDPAGSAESYISTTSTPGTTTVCTETSIPSQRPASICGLPSLNNVTSAISSLTPNTTRSPTSLGLYFQDGSSTLMSFATPDLLESWLRLLSAVVGTNRSRSGYPHIEYASTVTCRFKAKEFNSGPFPKIKGECLFCLSKLDVLLITQNIKQPDLSIRFPYVRNCASRDDGRLCLDIGRAAPTGECELVLQMPNAREAKAAHTRCIMLMRQCPTWLKLGRDGPSSRRRTLPNFGKKTTGVNLAGPPLPRVLTVNANPTLSSASTPAEDQRMSSEPLLTPTLLPIVPETSIAPGPKLLTPPLPLPPPAPLLPLSDVTSVAFSSHSVSHLIGRRFHHYSSLSRKSHSFPSRLCSEPIPEVVVVDDHTADAKEDAIRPKNLHSEEEESPSTPTYSNHNSSNNSNNINNNYDQAVDSNNYYLQLNVDNLMSSHIKSIAKYTVTDTGGGIEGGGSGRGGASEGDERVGSARVEMPTEETIHHVLAYLSSITRPSKAVNVENEPPRANMTSRQPTVKFSPNPLMIPAHQSSDGFYVEPLIVGIDRLTTKVGSQSFEISRTSSTKKASVSNGSVQLRRPKRCFPGYASHGGSSVGVSSGGSGGSAGSNNRSRIYSHRDNDELFADLTYGPAASSRHTTLCQMSKGSTCERFSASFETGHISMVEETYGPDEEGKDHKRPRTASDTGTKWKAIKTAPIRFLPSSNQIADTVSRPRARSLTQQLATKPLSQPIGMKDLEGMPSPETYNGCVQLGSRSSSTTSTSKSIRRALEHVLGRPRSIEEGDALTTNATSPSHHYNHNYQQQQNKFSLHESEIYVEMDFPLANPSNSTVELPLETRNPPRGSLLITPSDSLSSNSSCLSFYGGSSGGGRQPVSLSRNTAGVSFSEHYGFVLGQAVASAVSASRPPFLIKPMSANASSNTHSAGCDIPSPTTAH